MGASTPSARQAVKDRIDDVLRHWTSTRERRGLERRLISAGVPASVAQHPTELFADPQLKSRNYFVTITHSEIGPMTYDGLITRFSAKKKMLHKAAPCVGEDTEYVLREILGLSPEEIADYAAAGALI